MHPSPGPPVSAKPGRSTKALGRPPETTLSERMNGPCSVAWVCAHGLSTGPEGLSSPRWSGDSLRSCLQGRSSPHPSEKLTGLLSPLRGWVPGFRLRPGLHNKEPRLRGLNNRHLFPILWRLEAQDKALSKFLARVLFTARRGHLLAVSTRS